MIFPVPVRVFGRPALRAPPARVCRINEKNGRTVHPRFVFNLLLQIIESSGRPLRPGPRGAPSRWRLGCRSGLQGRTECRKDRVHECLCDAVIHVQHPAVLSLSDLLRASSRGRCPPSLQIPPQYLARLFFQASGHECGLSCIIVRGGGRVHASVHADNIGRRSGQSGTSKAAGT